MAAAAAPEPVEVAQVIHRLEDRAAQSDPVCSMVWPPRRGDRGSGVAGAEHLPCAHERSDAGGPVEQAADEVHEVLRAAAEPGPAQQAHQGEQCERYAKRADDDAVGAAEVVVAPAMDPDGEHREGREDDGEVAGEDAVVEEELEHQVDQHDATCGGKHELLTGDQALSDGTHRGARGGRGLGGLRRAGRCRLGGLALGLLGGSVLGALVLGTGHRGFLLRGRLERECSGFCPGCDALMVPTGDGTFGRPCGSAQVSPSDNRCSSPRRIPVRKPAAAGPERQVGCGPLRCPTAGSGGVVPVRQDQR